MPDATISVKVDGVEPSIPVKLLNVKDNPERVKLFTAEDGTERFLVKGDENYNLVTPTDLSVLGGFSIDIEDKQTPAAAPNRPESGVVVTSSPVSPTPGQTGQ
jgi:hypothetical protein